MQFVIKLDIVSGELVTNIITRMEMLRPLTKFPVVPLILTFFNLPITHLIINFKKCYCRERVTSF